MDGSQVKNLRNRLKKTQSQLAKEIGVTTRTIQKWEAGDTIPTAMENLLESMLTNEVKRRTEFASNESSAASINEEMIHSLIDELSSQRDSSKKFQEQIDRLLTIIEKLSTK
jgi:Helix-turn-helix.